jgi:hypothetical protein
MSSSSAHVRPPPLLYSPMLSKMDPVMPFFTPLPSNIRDFGPLNRPHSPESQRQPSSMSKSSRSESTWQSRVEDAFQKYLHVGGSSAPPGRSGTKVNDRQASSQPSRSGSGRAKTDSLNDGRTLLSFSSSHILQMTVMITHHLPQTLYPVGARRLDHAAASLRIVSSCKAH